MPHDWRRVRAEIRAVTNTNHVEVLSPVHLDFFLHSYLLVLLNKLDDDLHLGLSSFFVVVQAHQGDVVRDPGAVFVHEIFECSRPHPQ